MPFEEVLAEVLGLSSAEITDNLGPASLGAWTSLRHVQMVGALQRAYSVRFAPREIRSVRSVGDFRSLLRDKGIKT